MRDLKQIFIVGLGLILTGCAGEPIQAPQFENIEDVKSYISETEKPICTLDVSQIRGLLQGEDGKLSIPEFDYANDNVSPTGHAHDIRTYYRRAALQRRLNIEADTSLSVPESLTHLSAPNNSPANLKDHLGNLEFWGAERVKVRGFISQDNVAGNLKWCLINERSAIDRAASRKALFMHLERSAPIDPDVVLALVKEQYFGPEAYDKAVLNLLSGTTYKNQIGIGRFTIMRGSNTLVIGSDPKDADGFWTARGTEIEAGIDYIKAKAYKQNADKLADIVSVDQGVRNLFNKHEALKQHFEAESYEMDSHFQNVGQLMFKIDRYGTQTLKTMLEGREWITDARDGTGAADDAWLIAQHADADPDFQRHALTLIEAKLEDPSVSKSNYAYLYDRVAGKDEKPQRFATQGRCTGDGTWEPNALEDPENIDSIRAEVGLSSLAEYKSRFKDICVRDER